MFKVFKDKGRAERIAFKVARSGMDGLNLNQFWDYSPSPCSPLAAVQAPTRAVRMSVPALSGRGVFPCRFSFLM